MPRSLLLFVRLVLGVVTAALLLMSPRALTAQTPSLFKGNVLADGSEKPIPGAEISLPQLKRTVLADSLGAFRVTGIPAGRHQLVVRHVGFTPIITLIDFAAGDSVDTDLLLSPATAGAAAVAGAGQALPGVTVTTEAPVRGKLAGFDERRRGGLGSFITAEQMAKLDNSRMTEILATVPGLKVVNGTTNAGWVASMRGSGSILRTTKPDPFDLRRGAKTNVCYSAVMLDGVTVYSGADGQPLFDINSLEPNSIAGIEFYAGPASMPTAFNATRVSCGLIVIWTK